MAQVANRYYNSPWIKDAADNLSMALFSTPERDAARLQQKQTEANMLRQQEADRLAIEDRTRAAQGRDALSNVFLAAEDDIPTMASNAIRFGVDPNAVSSAMGTASPKYRQQAGLAELRGSIQNEIAGVKLDVAKAIADQSDATRRRIGDQNFDAAMYGHDVRLAAAQLSAETRRLIAKEKGPGGTPINIPPKAQLEMSMLILQMAKNEGGTVDPQLISKIARNAVHIWQDTRDAPNAALEAWTQEMGEAVQHESGGRKWWGGAKPDVLVPQSGGAAVAPMGSPGAAGATPSLSSPFLNPVDPNAGLFMQPQFGPRADAAAPLTASPTAAPAEAIQLLKQNPTVAMKQFFKQKYGYLPAGL